jgi:hypothetical protein
MDDHLRAKSGSRSAQQGRCLFHAAIFSATSKLGTMQRKLNDGHEMSGELKRDGAEEQQRTARERSPSGGQQLSHSQTQRSRDNYQREGFSGSIEWDIARTESGNC